MGKRISLTDALDVLKAGRNAQDSLDAALLLLVLVDESAPHNLVCAVRDAFVAERTNAEVVICALGAYATRQGAFDACIMLLGDAVELAGIAAQTCAKRGIPVALIAETSLAIPDVKSSEELPITNIVASSAERVIGKLAHWLVRASDKHLAIGANFAFCRDEEIKRLTNDCAVQCAAVGALGLVPGADLPVMCANQSKLALQIAAVYGHELNLARVGELAGVVGAGFAWRAVARQAVGLVPGVGWLIKAGIGYAGTQATAAGIRAKLDPNAAEDGIFAKLGGAIDSARGLLAKKSTDDGGAGLAIMSDVSGDAS